MCGREIPQTRQREPRGPRPGEVPQSEGCPSKSRFRLSRAPTPALNWERLVSGVPRGGVGFPFRSGSSVLLVRPRGWNPDSRGNPKILGCETSPSWDEVLRDWNSGKKPTSAPWRVGRWE